MYKILLNKELLRGGDFGEFLPVTLNKFIEVFYERFLKLISLNNAYSLTNFYNLVYIWYFFFLNYILFLKNWHIKNFSSLIIFQKFVFI